MNDFGKLTTICKMNNIIKNNWKFDNYEIKEKISSCFGETMTFINYIPYLKHIKLYQFLIKINNYKSHSSSKLGILKFKYSSFLLSF